jgi:hypothetical protein
MGYTFGAAYTFGSRRPDQVKICTPKTKISSKKFPLIPPERGQVIFSLEALFNKNLRPRKV